MSHLTVPAYCAFLAGFCLALLLRAIQTSADSFVVIFSVASLYFAWRAIVETRRNWPRFRADMRCRSERRRREAQQKRCRYPGPS